MKRYMLELAIQPYTVYIFIYEGRKYIKDKVLRIGLCAVLSILEAAAILLPMDSAYPGRMRTNN